MRAQWSLSQQVAWTATVAPQCDRGPSTPSCVVQARKELQPQRVASVERFFFFVGFFANLTAAATAFRQGQRGEVRRTGRGKEKRAEREEGERKGKRAREKKSDPRTTVHLLTDHCRSSLTNGALACPVRDEQINSSQQSSLQASPQTHAGVTESG